MTYFEMDMNCAHWPKVQNVLLTRTKLLARLIWRSLGAFESTLTLKDHL